MNEENPHDPAPRLLPHEPYLTLAARDPIAPGHGRLYALTRGREPDARRRAHVLLDAIFDEVEQQPPAPHKDKEHAWSARRKADEMETWRLVNMPKPEATGRPSSFEFPAAEVPLTDPSLGKEGVPNTIAASATYGAEVEE